MKNEKYFYTYSYQRANFLIQNGIELLEIGTGRVDGIFFKFLRTGKSKEAVERYKKLNGLDN